MTTAAVDALIENAHDHYRRDNALPSHEDERRRGQALEQIRAVLGDELGNQVRSSPLGPGWTDVFVAPSTLRPPDAQLREAGWLSLRPLMSDLSWAEDRWAVTAGSHVLAAISFLPAAVTTMDWIARRSRASGMITLRDVLELRELKRGGEELPRTSALLTTAADIEVELGSRDLVRWASGNRLAPPARVAGARGRLKTIGFSGVDGAGKSSVVEEVRNSLTACGIPTSRIWLRPGMGLGRLVEVAHSLKRIRRMDSEPGVAAVAADPQLKLPSRSGATGWAWATAVTASFLSNIRRQHRAARGVVLYDRHEADALVTLSLLYGRPLNAAQQRWTRRLMPPADLSFYLDLPAEVAMSRKPEDLVGESAVRRQLELYQQVLLGVPHVHVLDAQQPVDITAARVLEAMTGHGHETLKRAG